MEHQQRPRIVRGCEVCRAAHAKCDAALPTCGRCALLKCECIRGLAFPFRHSNNLPDPDRPHKKVQDSKGEFDFEDDQIWVDTPDNVEFVFEYSPDEEQDVDLEDISLSPRPVASPMSRRLSDASSLPKPHNTTQKDALPLTHAALTPEDYGWPSEPPHENLQDGLGDMSTGSGLSAYSPCMSRVFPLTPDTSISSTRQWPLADDNEAFLLRYFVIKLALWFDYCDPQKTFATSVVQCAATSAPLLYAILAVAARHLNVTRGHDSYTADRYHRECLSLLIPILGDNSAALDEALYAATVILRVYEEISVPLSGQDNESHLMGTHTFVRAQDLNQPSGIRQAAFRVVLRQEIVIAFRTQRPVQLLREYIQVDRSLDRLDDWTFAFHIIVLCAEVLTCCYGDERKTLDDWDSLLERARVWMDSKPITFEPLVNRPPDHLAEGSAFPEILLLNDCHVAAHQHYLICQVLLAAHDPRRPQLGPRREATNRFIRDHVRNICGIAVSNSDCSDSIPSMFTASMVIGICGDLFVEDNERKAMMDILTKTDLDLGWPTGDIQSYLRQKWAWS